VDHACLALRSDKGLKGFRAAYKNLMSDPLEYELSFQEVRFSSLIVFWSDCYAFFPRDCPWTAEQTRDVIFLPLEDPICSTHAGDFSSTREEP
jgi:hypothetical protein